jgi:hypothetical protein
MIATEDDPVPEVDDLTVCGNYAWRELCVDCAAWDCAAWIVRSAVRLSELPWGRAGERALLVSVGRGSGLGRSG